MKDSVKQGIRGSAVCDHAYLDKILTTLGLTSNGQLSTDQKSKNLVTRIQEILLYHFGNDNEEKRANILAKLLMDGSIAGKDAGKK